MMTVGLHCRLVGRPGRAAGLSEFMDFAKSLGKDVWICTREQIARHWYDHHYPRGGGSPVKVPSEQSNDSDHSNDQTDKNIEGETTKQDGETKPEEPDGDVI